MKKVIIIGSPGSGKSTFARRLREKTGLPLYYLDLIWHRSDRTNITTEEFDRRLMAILREDQRIIEGNYLRTLEIRLQACDTVFLLDYPVDVCLQGAKERIGTRREDLPWVETGFDGEFRQWILDFPNDQLPRIYELLEQYRDGKEIHIFRSREEAEEWLGTVDSMCELR